MARQDIWQDGVHTRFTSENQPANRGRKKGRPNRATILRLVFQFLQERQEQIDQQRRDYRNARRRERYALKKWAGGTTPRP